jgi:hypothetical protein
VYVASWDPVFLQWVINVLVEVFKRVGLETNVKKTQTMTCTPGKSGFSSLPIPTAKCAGDIPPQLIGAHAQ